MNYIDLYLSHQKKSDLQIYSIEEIVNTNDIVVILGSPGSGKTSLLKKYSQNKHIQFLNVKNFIKLSDQVHEETKVLLLDGLDEYRSVENDKTFVMSELGHKINKLKNIKIVISCRSLDWYGETDQTSLKEQVSKKAEVYSILPLNLDQQREMAKLQGIENIDTFINKFSNYGFLDNPQMFKMVAKLFKENPENILDSKKKLYETFVKSATEKNLTHKTTSSKQLEPKEILKYTGYLAFYYMFSGINKFDENILDIICDIEKGYSKEDLEATLKTTLFDNKSFMHRTIAEFSLAYFLVNYKLNNTNISKNRLKTLFVKNNKIATELRSVYAWICSLSEDEYFISVDPYYQAIYGDNSHFSDSLKQKIILSVREYSKTNPYFIEWSHREIEGFYSDSLGEFLVDELKYALKQKTHYSFFLINIFKSAKSFNKNVKTYLQSVIKGNGIHGYIKDDLIPIFKDDINFLKSVLAAIKEGQLKDNEDEIKEAILKILYPKYISHKQIAPYLMLYKKEIVGYCYYLDKTPYEHKFDLVDTIHKLSFEKKEKHHNLHLPQNTESFISEYFLETILLYDQKFSAKEIYKIIKHFRRYYANHQNIEYRTFNQNLLDQEKKQEKKLIELTNKLFSIYIDEQLLDDEIEHYSFYKFMDFFSYKMPTDVSDLIFEKMSEKLKPNQNEALFFVALSYCNRDEKNRVIVTDKIKKIIKKYGLEKKFETYQNPPKQEWQIEEEKRIAKKKAKEQEIKRKNEEYFSSKSDEDIQSSFNDLYYISHFYYIEKSAKKYIKYLTKETFKRLTNILKNSIYSPLIEPDYLTIKSLAKDSPQAGRNIDEVYFSSLYLNKKTKIEIENIEFLKYLYITSIVKSNTANINHNKLIEQLENENLSFAIDTLKEYIELLLDNYLPKYKDIFLKYLKEENSIKELKNLAMLSNYQKSYEDSMLENCLESFNFKISFEDLKKLTAIKTNDKNQNMISTLLALCEQNRDQFTINMAIALHSIFEYHSHRFKNLKSDLKIRIIDYIMNKFDTEKSIESVNGFQSSKNICASFLRHDALNLLKLHELKSLQKLHRDEGNIWYPRITHKINELEQQERDLVHETISIETIKNFIFEDDITSKEDFFADIIEKLQALKREIEDNRNNDKKPFYNSNNQKKNENDCRDIILHRLNDKYSKNLLITKEKHEADNRVDINIKYRANNKYEVQIECKRDDNANINKGIEEQLIKKYFSSDVQYGIYLIFYFGTKKDKKSFLDQVEASLPKEYIENIKIVIIDLT